MLHLDTPSIEIGVTRAAEYAESLEDMRSVSLVERTRTNSLRWITVTENDDDHEDDEAVHNKLLILVAKDVKTVTCLQEKSVSENSTSWLVSLLRRLGYRRAILQTDGGHQS